ncbi:MAG: cysteine desulfurase [Spirochaetaceae bacterium]
MTSKTTVSDGSAYGGAGRDHALGFDLDVDRIRRDFPILKRTMRGKPFVYLDNAATSLKPQQVIDAEVHYYTHLSSNIHRGVYEFSEQATIEYDEARAKVRSFINAPGDGHVVFTRGATEAMNIIAFGWGRKAIGEGDEIVLSELEHHANFVPWQRLAEEKGATLKFIPVNPDGATLDLGGLDSVITERTKVVAISAMSNVTGYMPPLERILGAARAHGAVTVVDAAQLASHHSVDVADLDCDFLAFSGHKMCGPTGVGVLYGKAALLEETDPLLFGGDMIVKVRKERTTFKELPDRFEAGTPNIAGVLGLGAAIDYLNAVGMDAVHRHEQALLAYAEERVRAMGGVTIYGTPDLSLRGGILSFNVEDVHPHDTGAILDQEGIAVRTGFHCAQPLMQVLGVPGTTRASFYLYNTTHEIDLLVDGIRRVQSVFG